MSRKAKWTIYQIIALLIFIAGYLFIHQYMRSFTVQPNGTGTLFMLGVVFYVPVSWIYITIYFQQKKHPKLLEHKIWRRLPALVFVAGIVSLILFIILVTTGPLMEWMNQDGWIFYLLITYSAILFFLFILSIVYKMSESRDKVIHYSYIWSLAVIFVFSFLL